MVSSSVIAALFVSTAALVLVPVVLLLVLCLRRVIDTKPMALGIAAFFVSQLCLRIPILQGLGTQGWFRAFARTSIPYMIFLAVTAGLFEESARYVCARFLLKKNRAFRDAVAFGLGHGLCETVLLVGMTQVNDLIYAFLINNGAFQAVTAALPAATGKQILSAMLAATPVGIYVAVWERVSSVLFHLFATVLIFQGVRRCQARYYFFAIGAHALTDFSALYLTNIWICESVVSVYALLGAFYIWKTRASFREPENA